MTVGAGQIAGGSAAASDAARAWQAVRADAQIQYEPLKVIPQREPPGWLMRLLKQLSEWLEAIFEPIARLLGMSWPTFRWVLLGLAVVLALYTLWRLVGPLLLARRGKAEDVPDVVWTPDREQAQALLDEADRLAAAGQYGEAAHLLLRRSVRQIADERPEWLHPASTAREIAALEGLPEAGRRAFAVIAQGAERAVFALRDLDAAEWQAAREAYASFAALRLPGAEAAA